MLILFTKEKVLAESSCPLNIKARLWEGTIKDGVNNSKADGIMDLNRTGEEIKEDGINKDHHQTGIKATKETKVGVIKDQIRVGETKDLTKDGEIKDLIKVKAGETNKVQTKVGEIKDLTKVTKAGAIKDLTKEIKGTKDGEMDGDRITIKNILAPVYIYWLG